MEIVKSWKHNGKKPLFYFYRDTRQNEIDLLIREGDTIKRGPGALICTCDEPRYLTSDVIALPVWAL